jgi:hypothetical protein
MDEAFSAMPLAKALALSARAFALAVRSVLAFALVRAVAMAFALSALDLSANAFVKFWDDGLAGETLADDCRDDCLEDVRDPVRRGLLGEMSSDVLSACRDALSVALEEEAEDVCCGSVAAFWRAMTSFSPRDFAAFLLPVLLAMVAVV